MAKKPSNSSQPKRYYSQKTIKVLFALSGNQCAHPECTNTLIEPATEDSGALVSGHICHIYAVSKEGPRGKPGLTEQQLNAPENLILLCRHHHGVVDGQHETYTAETLKQWKHRHEADIQKRLSADLEGIHLDVFSHAYFPTELVDQKIEEEVSAFRKSRFFTEYDRLGSALVLAERLSAGEYAGGSAAVRCRALAWCARVLSRGEKVGQAEHYLGVAEKLGHCDEIQIAKAFISSERGNTDGALGLLFQIETPVSRSAALQVVAHDRGTEAAIEWLDSADLSSENFDADGKQVFLSLQLELGRWDSAFEALSAITEDDLREAPVLHRTVALTHLLIAIPTELRSLVLQQLPFEAAGFPLASDEDALKAREKAHHHFLEISNIASELGCPIIATMADEYALWLELRDPERPNEGRKRLEEKLRDRNTALRLVHLGLQFGVNLDQHAIEREIERQSALSGGITPDAAMARFALAFTRESPQKVAEYIEQHFAPLSRHLDRKALMTLQVEMYSRAGLTDKANDALDALVKIGLTAADESRLRRVISESQGTDPVQARKEQFEATDALSDLAVLVDQLESSRQWPDL